MGFLPVSKDPEIIIFAEFLDFLLVQCHFGWGVLGSWDDLAAAKGERKKGR